MEFEVGLNVAFFLSTSLMEMGVLMKLEWSGTVRDQNSTVFPLSKIYPSVSWQCHQSFSKTIALWMVWAAGDVVCLIEIQEVVELSGTVTRSIVQS